MKKQLLLLLSVPMIGLGQKLDYDVLLKNHIINVWTEPNLVTEGGYIIENTANELSLYSVDSSFLQTYSFPLEDIPDTILNDLKISFVSDVSEVLKLALGITLKNVKNVSKKVA